MRFNKSTPLPDISTPENPSVRLNCANLRVAFVAFDMVFILFSLVFICQIIAHNSTPELETQARAINDYFGKHVAAFMTGPVVILITIMYFSYGRKKLTWQNGLFIDDEPVTVAAYQFKKFPRFSIMYFQVKGKLWILYPTTSQDGYKFPDVEIIKKESVLNEIQVKILKDRLEAANIPVKSFWFFSYDVPLFVAIFITITVVAFLN